MFHFQIMKKRFWLGPFSMGETKEKNIFGLNHPLGWALITRARETINRLTTVWWNQWNTIHYRTHLLFFWRIRRLQFWVSLLVVRWSCVLRRRRTIVPSRVRPLGLYLPCCHHFLGKHTLEWHVGIFLSEAEAGVPQTLEFPIRNSIP